MFKQITAPDPKALVQSLTASPMPELASARSRSYSTRAAGQLLSLYRKGDAQDPEAYVAGLGAVLSEYPEDVVAVACDPRTGIARCSKWLPTIAEVSEFCEDLMRPSRETAAYQLRVKKQLQERTEVFGKFSG